MLLHYHREHNDQNVFSPLRPVRNDVTLSLSLHILKSVESQGAGLALPCSSMDGRTYFSRLGSLSDHSALEKLFGSAPQLPHSSSSDSIVRTEPNGFS